MKMQHISNLASGLSRGMYLSFERKIGKSLPRWLWLGLTDRCNSRCRTCLKWKEPPGGKEMSVTEIQSMLSDPIFKNVGYIINSGGEPTVRRDFFSVLLAEHRALPGATIQISTNSLLPDRVLDCSSFLLDVGAKVDVGISLDGIGKAHDLIRGVEGNFEQVRCLIWQLKPLKKKYPKQLGVGVGSTLTDLMLDNYPSVERYADLHGLPFMFHWYDQSPFYTNPNPSLEPSLQAMLKAIDVMPRTLYYEMWRKRLMGREAKFKCFALHTFLVIKPNGDVAPCLHRYDEKVGNVLESSPSQIWKSEAMESERSKIKDCSDCLNSWAFGWSLDSYYWPRFKFEIRNKLRLMARGK